MPHQQRTRFTRYAVAPAAVGLVLVCRLALNPVLHDASPFIYFFLAIIVSTWLGGFGPGLVATVLTCIAVDYYYLPPLYALWATTQQEYILIVSFLILGSLVSAIVARMRHEKERAEQAGITLAKEKDLLQYVMNGAKNSHLVYLDRNFNFLRVNEVYARTCGYRPEEMIGKNHFALYPHEENEAIFARVRDTGEPVEFHDKPFVFPGQPERGVTYWDWTLVPIKEGAGKVEGLVFSLVETTERKRTEDALRQNEERYRTLFTSMNEGFALGEILLDDAGRPCDWRYLEVNPAFERNTGIPVAGIIGRRVREVLPNIEPEWIEFLGKVALTGEPAKFEYSIKELGRFFEAFASCPAPGRFACLFFDVTPRKKIEDTLRFLIQCGNQEGELFFDSLARYLAGVLAMDYVCIDRLLDDTLTAQTLAVCHDGRCEANVTYTLKDTPCGAVVGNMVCCFPRGVRDLFPADAALQELRAESYLGVTLWNSKGQPIGLIAVIGRHPLGNPQLAESILKLAAVRAAGELERQQAEEKLRDLQRATAQSLALLDTLQTHAPIGIAFVDRDFRFVRVNEELAAMNGIPAAAHIGRTVAEIVPALWPQLEPIYRRILDGGPVVDIEVNGETPAHPGQTRHWDVAFYPVRMSAEEVTGLGVIVIDITARKQAEEILRRQSEQLMEDDRRKNEFLGMLAHELRNPLVPIRNAAQLLRLGGTDPQSVKRQEEMIERQVSHMARLLDDLLDVARITQGKITLKSERLDLRAVVDRAIETSAPFIKQFGHCLRYDSSPEPLWLEGDGARLEQVICNLLNNAIKYTETGGQIWVSLQREIPVADPAVSPWAVLRIRDSGVGIAPDMLPRVFDLFTQAERSLDRAQGGLGIGLNLVRRLVELHGGTIAAHSAGLGQGSEFVVRLPLRLTHEIPATPADREPATAEPANRVAELARRVLIVEDNVDGANSLGDLLRIWGHPVRMVYDGAAALAAALDFKPDVVLLDLGLPVLSGCELAPLLRAEPSLASAAIIAMTGFGQAEDRRLSLEAGFDDHLTKPVDLERLRELLQGR